MKQILKVEKKLIERIKSHKLNVKTTINKSLRDWTYYPLNLNDTKYDEDFENIEIHISNKILNDIKKILELNNLEIDLNKIVNYAIDYYITSEYDDYDSIRHVKIAYFGNRKIETFKEYK
jgi:hypothetical protein